MQSRVPIAAVAGFLGAGKTTLINHLLSDSRGIPTAVIVNEFGALGIDGRLIRRATGGVVELTNGCVCCEVRGDLATAVRRLLKQRDRWIRPVRFERIWIELSGMARPGPVVQTFQVQPDLVRRCEWQGVVTLVHCEYVREQMEQFDEAVEQVAVADHIVMNHRDRVDGSEVEDIRRFLSSINPLALLSETQRANMSVDSVWPTPGTSRFNESVAERSGVHTHGDVQCLSFCHEEPVDLHRLKLFLQFTGARFSGKVLRQKGIFRCSQHTQRVVAQGIYQWLELGPEDGPPPQTSEFVIIGRDLNEAEIGRGWASLIDSTRKH